MSAESPVGTGAVIESYVEWVNRAGTHVELVEAALAASGDDPRRAFDALYRSMGDVVGFGRTARFDYLAMVGNLSLGDIEPGSAYLSGATGPLRGARALFGPVGTPNELDEELRDLDKYLGVGMQVLEDALCNWQKSPSRFVPYRG